MIRQFFKKNRKILNGVVCSKIKGRDRQYDGDKWWDSAFYTSGVSDSKTISIKADEAVTRYHYCSVEQLILRHLINHDIVAEEMAVMDIGSGSGHWIDFWAGMGARQLVGMDVSGNCYEHLQAKYADTPSVAVHHGRAVEVLRGLDGRFDIVNAIGVMFHIVDDQEWHDTVASIGTHVRPGGYFVIGGHFGFWNGIDVQVDGEGNSNKRLRSRRHWLQTLRESGFDSFHLYRNRSYLQIKYVLPENSILIAKKRNN